MKLLIFTCPKDTSAQPLHKEAEKQGIESKIYFYSRIARRELKFNLHPSDKIILRDPYSRLKSYSHILQRLLNKYYNHILLDKECYKKFPNYEDKFFQAKFLARNHISIPSTISAEQYKQIKIFPILVKKRISSAARGNTLIKNKERLVNFFKNHPPEKYIIQEYIPIKADLRILILKNKILGIAQREIKFTPRGKIKMKFRKPIKNTLMPQIIREAKKIRKLLKVDLAGIDVLISKHDNKFYFLEVNASPQFTLLSRVLHKNIAKKIINSILSKQ